MYSEGLMKMVIFSMHNWEGYVWILTETMGDPVAAYHVDHPASGRVVRTWLHRPSRDQVDAPQKTCNLCGKIFYISTNYRHHMMMHQGLKPYKCSICHKTFTQKGNMKQHMVTHTGEKPFKCSMCWATFVNTTKLRYHMMNFHGEIRE